MELKEEANEPKRKKSVVSAIVKFFLWIIASVLFLIMLILILIQTSFVQNFARKKVVSYLQNKLKTEVQIGKLDVDFPTTLSLQKIFIAGQSKDTLMYGKEIKVDIDMVKLISKNIDIKEIALNGIVAKVKRLPPDSTFNFQFIVDAFNSPKATTKTKPDTSSMQMSIDRILVNKTRIIYKDLFTGNDMDLTFGHLDTKISKFDPSHMLFDIPSITLNGLHGYFNQLKPLQKPIENTISEAAAEPENYLQLLNKEIKLSDIDVAYKSDPSHINTSFKIGDAVLHPKTFDLKNSIITLKDASLSNSDIMVETNSTGAPHKPVDTASTAPPTPSMKIIAGKVNVENLNLKYDDQSAPKAPSGMDFSHIGIQQLSIKGSNIQYSSDTILASIQSGSMKEKSGFVLNNLSTDFKMDPTGVSLKNLLIETPGSEIKNQAIISYPSLTALKNDPGKLGLNIDLQNSKINIKDLLTFVPQLKDKISFLSPNSTLFVDTKITGQVNNLNFQQLVLRGLTATDINANGIVKGLPDPKKIYVDLTINKFQTSKKDLLSFIPKNALPKNISLPAAISANGKIKGGMSNLYADLNLISSLGNASFNGTLKNITDKNKAAYDIVLKAKNLEIGKIMQNPKLGPLTANFKAQGTGFDPKTGNADFSGEIPSVTLNKYNYHNLQVHGTIADKNYKINFTSSDPNLTAKLDAHGNFSGKYPTLHLVSTIDSIKTQPLNLTAQRNIYHGDINADFSNLDPDHLDGKLIVTHSIFVNDSNRINIDSLSLIANNSGETENIFLKSDFLNASIIGKYKLTQLGDVFKQAIDPYYSIDSLKDTVKVAPYDFAINASVIDNKTLRALLPQMRELRTINMQANFATDSGWSMYAKAPKIVYGNYIIDSFNIEAATHDSTLNFKTSLERFKSGSSVSVYATTLDGTLQHNNFDFNLNIKDEKSKNKYRLAGSFNQPSSNKYVFSLKPDSLLLNYKKWEINKSNQIIIANKDINAQNFILSQGSQQLRINSNGTEANGPLEVNFKDFKIETITGFIQNDSLMVNGLLNGNAIVKNIQTQPTFTADFGINNLSVYNDTIGNLTVKVNNNVANKYHADIALTGNGNDIKVNGDYNVDSANSTYDFVIDLKSFQMKALEGLSNGAIKDASGNLYGKIALKGSLKKPNIDGKIQFNNTAFNVTQLNNVFKIDNEAIAIINNEGILLNTFTIKDASNNAIVIDGAINSKDFLNYTFDLKIKARSFQAINSTDKDNQLFYGKMIFSTNLTVKGTPTHPIIDGTLSIDDKTDFTVVLPQNTPGIEKRKGIVRFVNRSAVTEDSLFMKPYDSLQKAPFQGFDISLNIKVSKNAVFNMIVDAGNGDFLRLKGDGQLTAGIDASGKITLVGTYEIDDGAYNLTFNFLKRKFIIQKGSKITWTGEPTSALIDITAIYIADAAPIDLVQDQLENSTSQPQYKQKLPFQVALSMKGELLKPLISFDILLPADKNYDVSNAIVSTVNTKLDQLRQEPDQMNKQVFALLLLNRFVGENPFASSIGSAGAGFVAMQSVSRLLSEQLNQLAGNLVQGVDLNVGLATTQDYTTGTKQDRTDLNVGVSKRLLSDRLTVSVGSDFQLQGPQQTNQQQNSLAGNISINYKLSKDGKYMLRVYRKNDYTGELDGYVIETGVGFVISVDFNKFKEIFTTKEHRREKREIKSQNKKMDANDDSLKLKDKSITTPTKAGKDD